VAEQEGGELLGHASLRAAGENMACQRQTGLVGSWAVRPAANRTNVQPEARPAPQKSAVLWPIFLEFGRGTGRGDRG